MEKIAISGFFVAIFWLVWFICTIDDEEVYHEEDN